MTENVNIRLEVPFDEIQDKVQFKAEDVSEFYSDKIKEEVNNLQKNFLKGKPCNEQLLIKRYHEAFEIYINIEMYKSMILNKLHEIHFKNVAKYVNIYFLRSSRAIIESDESFDFRRSFLVYVNHLNF